MEKDLLLPYRLRTVRLGVLATWMAIAALLAMAILPERPAFALPPYLITLGVGGLGVLIVSLLPWRRLFERGIGIAVMYAWSVLDIVLITVLLGIIGPDRIEGFVLYGLTTLFFAASYPPAGQVTLLLFTCASYLGMLVLTGTDLGAGPLTARLALLGITTFLTCFLWLELMREMRAHHGARADSERRSQLLASVAHAARGISFLESDRVLGAVTDSAVALGFEAVEICVYDGSAGTYRVAHHRNVPEGYANATHSARRGIVSMVLDRKAPVVLADYTEHPLSEPALRSSGFRAAIATPVWLSGRIQAILSAATKTRRRIGDDEREAFELLGTIAGRALENATLFEQEQRTVERMAELDRLKSEFLSTVSHEIRTPLTVIEGNGLTLEQHWATLDDRTKLEFIATLNSNARTLDGIITSLLDFSQLEAGKLVARPTEVEFLPLAQSVVARLVKPNPDHLVVVEVDEGLRVVADPLLLDRVIENLLSNALKYSPPGSGIAVTAAIHDGTASVSVADSGPGIPAEEVARLGERFFRGGDANARSTKGIGLGLALVREVLALHETGLEVASEVGRGSRFSFRLPLVAPAPVTSNPRSGLVDAG